MEQHPAGAPRTRRRRVWAVLATTAVIVSLGPLDRVAATDLWTAPILLSDPVDESSGAHLASSADGEDVAAVWSHFDGTQYRIEATASTDGGNTWTAPTALSAAGGDAFLAQVTSSADGQRRTAIWYRWNGANDVVQTSTTSDAGATWSAPVDVSSLGVQADGPQLTSSADGLDLVAAWYSSDGVELSVKSAVSADGGATWSAPSDRSLAGQSSSKPRVASSADGDTVVVVWTRGTHVSAVVQAAVSADGGSTWGPTTDLTVPGQPVGEADVASSTDGVTMAMAGRRWNGANWIALTSVSTDGGATWSSSTNLSALGGSALGVRIGASADGTGQTVVWQRGDGTHWIAQASTSADGGATWSSPIDLSATDSDASGQQVAVASDGTSLLVTWSRDGETIQVSLSSDAGVTWSSPVDLSTSGTASGPDVVLSEDATVAAVVWQESDNPVRVAAFVRTTVPGAPTDLVVTAGDGVLSVAFTPGSDGGEAVDSYEWSIDGGATWTSPAPATTVSPIRIDGLTNGTTYAVQVRGHNAIGSGAPSVTVDGTPVRPSGGSHGSTAAPTTTSTTTTTTMPPGDDAGTPPGTGTGVGAGGSSPTAFYFGADGVPVGVALPSAAATFAAASAVGPDASVAVTADGVVFTTDAADHFGSIPSALVLNRPVVNIAPRYLASLTADGVSAWATSGYWLVAADGGVFAFGDARFHGSTAAIDLNAPVVGIAATPSGRGYWLVAGDGGVFNFGDAVFYGSTGDEVLNEPVVSMIPTPTGRGYWLVARDGGVFTFGDAGFHGAGTSTGSAYMGGAATPSGPGYWLVTAAATFLRFGPA
jgi:hypothetical protein